MASWLLALWAAAVFWTDLHDRRIPNVLSMSGWLLGGAVLAISGHSLTGAHWTSALQAAGAASLLTLPGYAFGKLGAGDVKFLVAIGLLTSLQITMATFIVASLMGGAAVLIWLIPRSSTWLWVVAHAPWLGKWHPSTDSRQRPDLRMPFGSLLSIGLCIALLKVN
jgi:prepilin peptidase CpaA